MNSKQHLRSWLVPLFVLLIVAGGILLLIRPWTQAIAPPPALPTETRPPQVTPTAEEPVAEETVIPPATQPALAYEALALGFDVEEALEHLAQLASDAFGGRQPGTEGGRLAGEYIAAQFEAYGLEPAGEDGTYFQTFTVPYGRITELPELVISTSGGALVAEDYQYRREYRALTGGYSGGGSGEGPVVWLHRCRAESFESYDVTGQIVFCLFDRNPEVPRRAYEEGAAGLLLLDRESDYFRRGGWWATTGAPDTIPTYLISNAVAEDLLAESGYAPHRLPSSREAVPLAARVRMSVEIEEVQRVEARNVLGLIPGSDPELADEIVVLGAHYDHLGVEPDGEIMNGANDNASGTAVVIEIARSWQAAGYRPPRSVLFAAWDAEEQGLVGSTRYLQDQVRPRRRFVGNINLDMVGAGEELYVDGAGAVVTLMSESADFYGLNSAGTRNIGGSDHLAFTQKGISAANYIYWPDLHYHTPEDEFAVIDPGKLRDVGVAASHALARMAEEGLPQ